MAAGVGSLALAACGSDDGGTSGTAAAETTSDATTASDASASEIPEETGGPYPADGSNGPDVLTESGVVRQDITSSFGGMKGTADGVPTSLEMTLIDIAGGGAPLAGAALYLWHCDRDASYSLYDGDAIDQNYLRGVQVSDADGKLSFATIFPACYAGRWPHMHFEIYSSQAAITDGSSGKLRTSQLALPQDLCEEIYGSADGYEASATTLSQVSLDTDMVFADGYSGQLPKWSGSFEDGIELQLNVGV